MSRDINKISSNFIHHNKFSSLSLRCGKGGRLSVLSIIVTLEMLRQNLAALLCTASILLMLVNVWGSHMVDAYSSTGLTMQFMSIM